MKTLFLAWQDKRPRQDGADPKRGWYPIGRLDAEPREALYRFHYTRGVLRAQRDAGFQPLDAFPDLGREYESAELFPLFSNRVPSHKRGDYREFVERLGLSLQKADPFEILAVSGGGRQTDNLEVFPKIQKRRDGTFHCRFFLHGWRHVNAAARDRLAALREGETLRVALEINNPATGAAIQLQTEGDYHMVGWAPRYLIGDMLQALAAGPGRVSATVARLNPPPAPHNQRVLVEMEGSLPAAFEPMSGEDFQPLAAGARSRGIQSGLSGQGATLLRARVHATLLCTNVSSCAPEDHEYRAPCAPARKCTAPPWASSPGAPWT